MHGMRHARLHPVCCPALQRKRLPGAGTAGRVRTVTHVPVQGNGRVRHGHDHGLPVAHVPDGLPHSRRPLRGHLPIQGHAPKAPVRRLIGRQLPVPAFLAIGNARTETQLPQTAEDVGDLGILPACRGRALVLSFHQGTHLLQQIVVPPDTAFPHAVPPCAAQQLQKTVQIGNGRRLAGHDQIKALPERRGVHIRRGPVLAHKCGIAAREGRGPLTGGLNHGRRNIAARYRAYAPGQRQRIAAGATADVQHRRLLLRQLPLCQLLQETAARCRRQRTSGMVPGLAIPEVLLTAGRYPAHPVFLQI